MLTATRTPAIGHTGYQELAGPYRIKKSSPDPTSTVYDVFGPIGAMASQNAADRAHKNAT